MHYLLYLLIATWLFGITESENRFGQLPDPNQIDKIFEEFTEPDSAGCALGVNLNQELIYSKGYGLANLDYEIPITPSSRFMIASISKQFAAAALVMMEQEELLDLDEDLRHSIPQISQFEHPITARQIIQHTSGIRDIYDLLAINGSGLDKTTTKEAALEMLSNQKELNFTPGSRYLYSNMAYFLISEIVWQISGYTLREYTEKHFFQPIGMSSTHWHDDTDMIVPDRVISYRPTSSGPGVFFRKNMDRVGARGIVVTIEDFARWDNNFYENQSNLENFTEKMEDPGFLSSGEPADYATGLRLGRYQGFETVGHGGNYMGFRSSYARFPEHNLSVIVFCNMSSINPSFYANKVADLFLEEHVRESFSEYTGRYRNDPLSSEFSTLFHEGKLAIQYPGKQPEELRWTDDDEFRFGNYSLNFQRNEDLEITSVVIEASNTGPVTFTVN